MSAAVFQVSLRTWETALPSRTRKYYPWLMLKTVQLVGFPKEEERLYCDVVECMLICFSGVLLWAERFVIMIV